MDAKYVICINNESFPMDLTVHKVYRVIPDAKADKHGLIRLVDDSGEDYFFPAPMFLAIALSPEVEKSFAVAA